VYAFSPYYDTKDERGEWGEGMSDWNQQAAPNNNLSPKTIRTSKFVGKKGEQEFSEELSDGGERDQVIQKQEKKKRK
jgi:hypothetical protein